MVDEFQDTNRLQCELIDLLARRPATELFFVGDEFQSIYGFRHADVAGLPRAARAAPASVLPLTQNYRSRPEVLAVVNHLFGGDFGDEFQPLAGVRASSPTRSSGTPVELLVTDKARYADTGVHWRRGRGAARSRGACASSSTPATATPGEIVLLFAAGTDAEWYEEELRALGLPRYRATGRGYFGQQQVVDLLAYLRLLHNRYDDEALVTVLASPFVGVSNDALVLLRRAAPKRPLFVGLERDLPAALVRARRAAPARVPPALRPARRRVGAALARAAVRARSSRSTTTTSRCSRSGTAAAATRTCASSRGSRARTRSCAAPTSRASSASSASRRRVGATRARGGRGGGGRRRGPAADDPRGEGARVQGRRRRRRGPRHGARPRPTRSSRCPTAASASASPTRLTSERRGAFAYEEVREARKAEERAERLRLYYVAMTRAIDRLIVSGAIDPARTARRATPIGWVLGAARRARRDRARPSEPVELERDGARVLVRVDRTCPRTSRRPRRARRRRDGQLALFDRAGGGRAAAASAPPLPRARADPGAAAAPRAAALLQRARAVRALLVPLLRRARRRHAADRRAASRRPGRRASPRPRSATRSTACSSSSTCASRCRRRRRRARPRLVSVRRATRSWSGSRGFVALATASPSSRARIAALAGARARAAVRVRARRRAPARAPRRPAAGRRARARRRLQDELARRGDAGGDRRARLPAAAPRLRARLLPRGRGARSRSSTTSSSGRTRASSTTFARDEVPELEAELSAAIARINAGEFRPTPGEFTCAGCPALDVVCAGPRLPRRGPRAGRSLRSCWRVATSARRGGASGRSARGSARSSSGSRPRTRTRRSRCGSRPTSSCSSR